ncbi:MAG: PDZ domain-containing protein [Proteobacteria bacterium]|nr:PDZ domain-containing protein [Pseudomonadota bacterium]
MLALLLATALAGDPCPITLSFAEFTPEWRDRAADLEALESKRKWMGLSYRKRAGLVVVSKVLPRSPADLAGVKVGERIAAVNSRPVLSVEHANKMFDTPSAVIGIDLTLDVDGDRRSVRIDRGPADPVFLGLVNTSENQACRDVGVFAISDEQGAALVKGAFNEGKGFRCEDAHEALEESFESGSVVMIRGGRRLLLTMPGWTTQCVAVEELDGTGLTMDTLQVQLDTLTADYVKDRHDNP